MNKVLALITLFLMGCVSTHPHARIDISDAEILNEPVATSEQSGQDPAGEAAPPNTAPEAPAAPEAPKPHLSPFKGPNWQLEASNHWLGLEGEDGMMAIDRIDQAKIIILFQEPDELGHLVAGVSGRMKGNGIEILATKPVKVNGTPGVQLTTRQKNLKVFITLFSTKENSFFFGCGGLEDNEGLGKVCSEVRKGFRIGH